MAKTTYEDFSENYLVKDGMKGSALILNKAPDQLKKEIDKSNTIADSGNVKNFIAKGTIPDGKTVVLNADGTVSMVEGNDTNIVSNETIFGTLNTSFLQTSFIDTNKIVITYNNKAVIGIINGLNITFGNEYIFTGGAHYNLLVKLDTNKFAIIYAETDVTSYDGAVIVGTAIGTTINFGNEFFFSTGAGVCKTMSATLIELNKIIIFFSDGSDNSYGTTVVGTINDYNLTFGSKYIFSSNDSSNSEMTSTLVDVNKIAISYRDFGNSNKGTTIICTISGNTVTFGSKYIFSSANSQSNKSLTLQTNKIAIIFGDNGVNGSAVIGTITGNTITFGSKYIFNSAPVSFTSLTLVDDNNIAISYSDGNTTRYCAFIIGTISGTSITFGSKYIVKSAETNYTSILLVNKQIIITYESSNSGATKIIQLPGTSATADVIGITNSVASDGQTVPVIIYKGVNKKQTGLVPGTTYYVDYYGALTTNNTYKKVGVALSSTDLLVTQKGN